MPGAATPSRRSPARSTRWARRSRPLPRRARRGRGLLRRRRPLRGGGRDQDTFAATIEQFQRLTLAVLACPLPVLAAIDGVCIGGALEFAASCDLRIGTHRSRYATPEVRIGLGASNAGTLLLPEVLGESAARELLLTGQLKSAGWMNRHGFFNDVVDDLEAGIADWVRAFDATTRPAVAAPSACSTTASATCSPQAMERETQTCVELFPTPEAQEAVQRFARKD